MLAPHTPRLVLVGVLLGAMASCNGSKGDEDEGDSGASDCADVDGAGGDTGDVPNLTGQWSVSLGENIYDANACDAVGLTQEDLSEILAGPLEIDGSAPDGLAAQFVGFDTRYAGLAAAEGGVVFNGSTVKQGNTLYVSFGGHHYHQPRTDKDEIRGFGYVGVDVGGEDEVIDCWVQADWKASKSADSGCGDAHLDEEPAEPPNVLGAWTVTFGQNLYDANACTASGLTQAELSEILSGAMQIGGRIPDRLVASFSGFEHEYMGIEAANGGIVFSGHAEAAGSTLYVSFGGNLYDQPQVDRDEIRGFGYVGVDVDGEDQAIDCWIQADWKATKSGN